MADDVGDGLARDSPRNERAIEPVECGRKGIAGARQQSGPVAVEDMAGQHFGIECGLLLGNAGPDERLPGVREALVERRHQCTVWPESESASLSVASLSFSDVKCATAASMRSSISPSSARVSWCIVNPIR